jgi:phosphatidylglycerophosphate synthase
MNSPQRIPDGALPRRPLKTRQRAWAQGLARALTRAGVAPNAISMASLVFAAAAGLCLGLTSRAEGIMRPALLLVAAACIQLRLLCNMLDGLVAIEGGRKTVYGEIFNDMPDRFADVVILVGAGYSIANFSWGRELGWLAAVLAVMTAYVRLLGGSMGVPQYFLGPMAKPHRMALLTAACVFSVFENYFGLGGQTMACALVLMVAGMLVTCARRTMQIVADLKQRGP